MSAALPGFDYTTWYALYAPAATPVAVVRQINAAVRKTLADPALAGKIEPHGVELLGSTPDEVAQWVQRDTDKWGRIVREAGITID
jgi:tripartite-type tricarboxylate transporter receptor subunit TctC